MKYATNFLIFVILFMLVIVVGVSFGEYIKLEKMKIELKLKQLEKEKCKALQSK